MQPYFNFLAMGSSFVIFTWDALRSLSAVTGWTADFCAKSGAGKAMCVDWQRDSLLWWWHRALVRLEPSWGIGLLSVWNEKWYLRGDWSEEHGVEKEKEGVWPSSLVGTPEGGSLLFPEHPSNVTFKDIGEKEEHEVAAKAVLTGESHKEAFPFPSHGARSWLWGWPNQHQIRARSWLSWRVSDLLQWLAGTPALCFPQASLAAHLRVALPTGSVVLLGRWVDAHLQASFWFCLWLCQDQIQDY